ncbi:hypothetical protein LJC10_05790, partial [Selenomonadales bacterium OttesenSCG-928-I06]|nr:hypothetical protein [Selenomonadales bacterium OttesenSCG-928-I06]
MARGPSPVHLVQSSFTGGEISKDVASRVDLEKYNSALLKAENAIIKPYGGIYKRQGTVFIGETEYADRKSILVKFNFTSEICYMLEIGHLYTNVWDTQENCVIFTIGTPYIEAELPNLKFTQSADVMYIASGSHPVKRIVRYAADNWQLEELEINNGPYEPINPDSENELEIRILSENKKDRDVKITATKAGTFTRDILGSLLKISHDIPGQDQVKGCVANPAVITDYIMCGSTWKISTSGKWKGTMKVMYCNFIDDPSKLESWKVLRSYTSNEDVNIIESGTVEECCWIRVDTSNNTNTLQATLNIFPYTHTAHVRITEVENSNVLDLEDGKWVYAKILEVFNSTEKTADWFWGSFNDRYGYPSCTTFFQDRLVLAATRKNPHAVYMSKSGDYSNFGVVKASGKVTDDSAISINLISRELFKINHLVPTPDLVILTEGNEWIVSGRETVTPSKIVPNVQTSRGCSAVEPLYIGNRIIYIQKRGAVLRDMGYSYEVDNYTGDDLTLLAKHMVKGKDIVDTAYAQEPDSVIFLVRNDGVMLCLTYIREQQVFAWTRVITDGEFESVVSLHDGSNDLIYAVVKRVINGQVRRYIEKFFIMPDDNTPRADYVMLDCAAVFDDSAGNGEAGGVSTFGVTLPDVELPDPDPSPPVIPPLDDDDDYDIETGIGVDPEDPDPTEPAGSVDSGEVYIRRYVPHLAGKDVHVVIDGMFVENLSVDSDGNLDLPFDGEKVVVGLPYTMKIEMLNAEYPGSGGSMQAKKKKVDSVILRLDESFGGYVGPNFDLMDQIILTDSVLEEPLLYSLNKEITVANGGFETEGRVCIMHPEPFPFNVTMII